MGFSQSADTIKIVKLPDEYVYEAYVNQTKLIFRFGFPAPDISLCIWKY